MAAAEGGVKVVIVALGKITGIELAATCCPRLILDPPNELILTLADSGLLLLTSTLSCPDASVSNTLRFVPSLPAICSATNGKGEPTIEIAEFGKKLILIFLFLVDSPRGYAVRKAFYSGLWYRCSLRSLGVYGVCSTARNGQYVCVR
jgi:hypothetical protein